MGNKLVGTTSVKLGIYETSTDTQLAGMLGDKKEFEDGRVFRLCQNGGDALVAGILAQSIVSLIADDSIEIATTQSAGDYEVNVTSVTNAEHAVHTLAGGYLVMSDQADYIGTFYKIKDNEALVDGSNGIITLYDPLTTAITLGTNECSFCVNPYSGVILDNNTAQLVGVPLIAVDASTSTVPVFFWALCEGYGPATNNTASALEAGDYLKHAAGSVAVLVTAEMDAPIGVAVTAFASGDAGIVKYFAMA